MRIADRQRFTWRVKRPTIYALVFASLYIGVFTNVYFYGYPITGFVMMAPLVGAFGIVETIKKGDY